MLIPVSRLLLLTLLLLLPISDGRLTGEKRRAIRFDSAKRVNLDYTFIIIIIYLHKDKHTHTHTHTHTRVAALCPGLPR